MLYQLHGFYARAHDLMHARRVFHRAHGLKGMPSLVSPNHVQPVFGATAYDRAIATNTDDHSVETRKARAPKPMGLAEAQLYAARQKALIAELLMA